MNYLYHYTSVETLALILKNKSICFNNLLYVDDIEEAETSDMGQFGKFVYVSCWTDRHEESIPLWSMYTHDMAGVRIKMREYPFKKYDFQKGQYFFKQDTDTNINYEKFYEENKVSITPDQPKLIKVEYTNDDEKIYPAIRTEKHQNDVNKFLAAKSMKEASGIKVTYSFEELGKYKRKCWEFQNEWRYILTVSPMGLKEMYPITFHKQQELFRRLENNNLKPPYRQIFLEIEEEAFRSMEITLGPKIGEGATIMIKSLLEKYNPTCIVQQSSLKIR